MMPRLGGHEAAMPMGRLVLFFSGDDADCCSVIVHTAPITMRVDRSIGGITLRRGYLRNALEQDIIRQGLVGNIGATIQL